VQPVVLIDIHVRVAVLPGVTEVLSNVNVGAPGRSAANAASAWIKPEPAKSEVVLVIGSAVLCSAA
jgi:hypothetical protein